MATSATPVPLIEEIESRYGPIRFFAKDTVIGAALRLYGEWAENELRFFRYFIPSGGTVLDVGAFIGTHALAFARMVGPEGRVLSFEPQAQSFSLLQENVLANGLNQVHAYNAAVGATATRITLKPMNINDRINFGGLTVFEAPADSRAQEEMVEVVTIDSLGLTRCDFIKLDVEGSEDAALRGAVRSVTQLKPVIYAECNSLADSARSFAELKSFDYSLFVHVVDAFNPASRTAEQRNIFGPSREAGIIGVPPERREEVAARTDPSWQLFEINTLDDLTYALLQKPQYFDEVLRAGSAARGGGMVVSAVDFKALEDAQAQIAKTLEADKGHLEAQLSKQHQELVETQNALTATNSELSTLRQELNDTQMALTSVSDGLTKIKKSKVFKVVKPIVKAEISLRDKSRELRKKHRPNWFERRPKIAALGRAKAIADIAPAETVKAKHRDRVVTIRPRLLPGESVFAPTAVSSRELLVCVSHVSPCPPRAGNEYRILRMARWLQSIGIDVLLVICPLPEQELSLEQFSALSAEFQNVLVVGRKGSLQYKFARRDLSDIVIGLEGTRVRDFSALLQEVGASASRTLSISRVFCPDILLEILMALEGAPKLFAVLVNYCFMTRGFPLLRKGLVKIVDTHDVFSTKTSKVTRFGIKDGLALTAAEEGKLLSGADALLAIQPNEARELRGLGVPAKVLTVGMDMPEPPPSSFRAEEPVVLIVASGNDMNRKGLSDFLRFAWPLVLAAVPEAQLNVVGSVGEALTGYERNVQWFGHVDNLDAAYDKARLVINPAVAGTGLKIKTLEALSRLRPIVLWPSGVDGVSTELQAYCLCVTDWFQFAQSVILTLVDPAAGNPLVDARATITRMLSQDYVYAEFSAFLKSSR